MRKPVFGVKAHVSQLHLAENGSRLVRVRVKKMALSMCKRTSMTDQTADYQADLKN